MSSADPAALLLESLRDAPDTVPEGWHTAADWCERLGYSRPHTNRLIGEAVKRGQWEQRKFRVKSGNRPGLYPELHYRPLPTVAP